MTILLELIFQGFAEWVYGLVLECWNYFSSALLDIMSLDFAYIKAHVPVVEDITQIFLAVGWALLLGNLVFQAIRSMASGRGFEGEDPKLLFARTFVFAFLLLASPQICEIGLDLTSRIMALLEIPDVIDVHLVDSGLFGTLTAAWLLVIIFDIIIMFKVLKLLLEVAERYVILAVLSITAPFAFSMGGSKSTAEIFTGWCRMFGSMCLLMVTNVMFFKMLLSVVSAVPSGLDVFPWMVLIITIVKIAKKADEIITRIGLNPAITGDRGKGFGSALAYTVFRSAASKVIQTVGAAAAGGAGAAAGAAAGGVKTAAGAAGTAGVAGIAGAAARTGGQKGQRTAQEQQGVSSPQSGANGTPGSLSGEDPRRDGPSRKSSVSPGTRRAASHLSGGSLEKPVSTQDTSRTTGGFGGGGGRSGGAAGRDVLNPSGRKGAGRLRPITVYADDFDDGYEENSIPCRTGSTDITPAGAAGGGGRGSAAGPAGPVPPSKTAGDKKASGKRPQTTIKGGPTQKTQEDTRSTRRDISSSQGQPAARRSGGRAAASPTRTGDSTSVWTASPQKGSAAVRQEQQVTASRSGSTEKRGGENPASRFKRQCRTPTRQELTAAPLRRRLHQNSTAPARSGRERAKFRRLPDNRQKAVASLSAPMGSPLQAPQEQQKDRQARRGQQKRLLGRRK